MRFSYTSYKTIYESEGDLGRERLESRACFSRTFNSIADYGNNKTLTQEYKIYIAKDSSILKHHGDNYCLVSENHVQRYLRALQLLIPKIKWEIFDENYEEYNTFVIKIKVTATGFQHKYVLNYIRSLYEFPYNVILADAYKLKDLPEYKFESINNLYQLCALVFPGDYGTGHAITKLAVYCTNKKLIERLNSGITSLNRIYLHPSNKYERIHVNDYREEDYWTSEENFRKRLEIYNKTYKEWIKESM